jgi:hypothetical protein
MIPRGGTGSEAQRSPLHGQEYERHNECSRDCNGDDTHSVLIRLFSRKPKTGGVTTLVIEGIDGPLVSKIGRSERFAKILSYCGEDQEA